MRKARKEILCQNVGSEGPSPTGRTADQIPCCPLTKPLALWNISENRKRPDQPVSAK